MGSLIVDNLREDAPSGTTPEPDGILVVNVEADSRAAQLGLRTGDVITHVNGTRVLSMNAAAEVLSSAEAATFELRREGNPRVVITLN